MVNSKMVNKPNSENFNPDELILNKDAEKIGYDNSPNEEVTENFKEFTVKIFKPYCELISTIFFISSFYRCFLAIAVVVEIYRSPKLNDMSADFLTPSCHLPDSFHKFYKNQPFDQLIYDFDKRIFVSYDIEVEYVMRNEVHSISFDSH